MQYVYITIHFVNVTVYTVFPYYKQKRNATCLTAFIRKVKAVNIWQRARKHAPYFPLQALNLRHIINLDGQLYRVRVHHY